MIQQNAFPWVKSSILKSVFPVTIRFLVILAIFWIPVKVMGRDEPKFQAHVVKMISNHVAGISAEDVVTRPSSKGKFVSVTVTFTAENRQQLDDVYRTLTSDEQVLYVL